jgi:uncharacterized damage-inducible protein DinB
MHPVDALFRRNAWATAVLLRWCSEQDAQTVAKADPDVYGSIESLFNHILAAEGRYLRLLTGRSPVTVSERSWRPLRELGEGVGRLAEAWSELLAEDRDIEALRTHERGGGRTEMPDWLPIVQALHHGDDHRTQVGTLLLRAQLVMPELDVWVYSFYELDPPGAAGPLADRILRRCFGYHLWATRVLLERCARLSAEEMALSAPGTLGSIGEGCSHLVSGDRGYWSRLVGRGPGGDLEDESVPAMLEEWRLQQERWTDYLASAPDPEVTLDGTDGRFKAWVRVAQAFHHGNDHRTQIGTALLHHGLEAPEIDVWAYAEAEGVLREIA